MRIPKFRSITTLLIASLAVAIPALAQGFTFGLRPEDQSRGYFEYSLNPGDRVEDAVLAVNGTEKELRLVVTRVAGHTALTGGISFPGDANGPAQWLSLPDEGVLSVPANLALRLPFTLTIPEGTPPGEYVAGFLSTPEDPAAFVGGEPDGGGFQVDVIPQMGVSMIITVLEPDHCEVRINSFKNEQDKGEWKVVIDMLNAGNIHFKGLGVFILHPAAGGEPVLQRSFNIGYFVPGETLGYPLYFDTFPPAGEYIAEVALVGGDCEYKTQFSQAISISTEQAALAAADAERWSPAEQQGDTMLRNVYILLSCLVVLFLIVIVLLVLIFRRKRKAEE